MRVLGLTGSIGTGKTTTARLFAEAGVPVHDADAAVHRLYAGALVPAIEAAFPGSTSGGSVDRAALAKAVLGDADALRRLESVVHPAVRAAEAEFLAAVRRAGARLAVIDVPLLLETRRPLGVDAVLVVTCSAEIQRQRVLARPGMTEERFAAIRARQMPDAEKRRHAHFIIDSGFGIPAARGAVADLLRAVASMF
jgi:dephospho-CoA kinase